MKKLRNSFILVPCFVLALVTNTFTQAAPRRVIIDTDPGTDDAMAIILALNSPEFKVEALTVVPGNVDGRQGLENALKIVSLAGRCDVMVAGGAQHPLNQKLITAQFWHGKNGLANIELPQLLEDQVRPMLCIRGCNGATLRSIAFRSPPRHGHPSKRTAVGAVAL